MKNLIFPTITSTKKSKINDFLKEAVSLKLKEACVFFTCLNIQERKKLYRNLRDVKIQSIPFVHLRSDTEKWEVDYLIKNFKTKYFNIHSSRFYPLDNDLSPFLKQIYIENTHGLLDINEIRNYGGICLDFSHLDNQRRTDCYYFKKNLTVIKSFPHPCGHISAGNKNPSFDNETNCFIFSSHRAKNKSDFNYLKKYLKLIKETKTIALELENSLTEQLEYKAYIINLLNLT